jgi:excisionase family DNA binding protein
MDEQQHSSPTSRPLLVKVEEGARILGISRSLVYELMNRGELPWVKCGSARRLPLAALEQWVAAHTRYGA